MQRRCIAGTGVDCVQFVFAVLRAADAVPDFPWPSYRQDVGFSSTRNHLADLMQAVLHVESLNPIEWEPRTGDIGIFKVGRTSNHTGIVVGGRFWHVTTRQPVHSQQCAVVRPTLQEVLRLTAAGLKSEPENLNCT